MLREIGQGISGLAEIAYYLPKQTVRTIAALPDPYRQAIIQRIQRITKEFLMSKGYFFNEPQLFKMPEKFIQPGPPLTESPTARSSSLGDDDDPYVMPYPGGRLEVGPHGHLYETMGAFQEDTLKKALPYIVAGIVGIIGYNMFFRKK